jgi:hypothetical protein
MYLLVATADAGYYDRAVEWTRSSVHALQMLLRTVHRAGRQRPAPGIANSRGPRGRR